MLLWRPCDDRDSFTHMKLTNYVTYRPEYFTNRSQATEMMVRTLQNIPEARAPRLAAPAS